jgi:hypothetical protein
MPKTRVFVDTNVIIEAFRTGCWSAICAHYSIETVEKCVEEALTGNPNDARHVDIPPDTLNAGLANRLSVTRLDIANLVMTHPSCAAIDDGEMHLLAWLFASNLHSSALIVVSTADKAALIATHSLGFLDNALSLESLATHAGVVHANLNALSGQYREGWLTNIKTKIRMGVIP